MRLKLGKIDSPHALKGEFKVRTDQISLKIGSKVYLDDQIYYLESARRHQKFLIIKLDRINSIEEVYLIKNKELYLEEEAFNLKEGQYLDSQLIGFKLIIDGKLFGELLSIEKTSNYTKVLVVKTDKIIYLPYHQDLIKKIDLLNKEIEYIGGDYI